MTRTLLTAMSTVAVSYMLFAFYSLTVGYPDDFPLYGWVGFISLIVASLLPVASYMVTRHDR